MSISQQKGSIGSVGFILNVAEVSDTEWHVETK